MTTKLFNLTIDGNDNLILETRFGMPDDLDLEISFPGVHTIKSIHKYKCVLMKGALFTWDELTPKIEKMFQEFITFNGIVGE